MMLIASQSISSSPLSSLIFSVQDASNDFISLLLRRFYSLESYWKL